MMDCSIKNYYKQVKVLVRKIASGLEQFFTSATQRAKDTVLQEVNITLTAKISLHNKQAFHLRASELFCADLRPRSESSRDL